MLKQQKAYQDYLKKNPVRCRRRAGDPGPAQEEETHPDPAGHQHQPQHEVEHEHEPDEHEHDRHDCFPAKPTAAK